MPKRKSRIRRKKQIGCSNRKSKKGGCVGELACGFNGGQRGGGWFDGLADQGPAVFPASFSDVPIRSFYPHNDFSNDPNHLVVGARNTAPFSTGGKRRKSRGRKSRGSRRVQKGGYGFLNDWYSTYNPTPQSTLYSASNPPYE
jgi:hypothetical protein